ARVQDTGCPGQDLQSSQLESGSMKRREAIASAPGKCILFGEHAVVHGKKAVAASLSDLRMVVHVHVTEEPQICLSLPDLRNDAGGPLGLKLPMHAFES
ncbi:unnamed protein product, partial [Chrysoparadoxa australica]